MSVSSYILWVIAILWLGGGTIWTLKSRRYRWYQIPSFLIDLLGFPVDLAQRIWGRKGVPYAFLLPNMVLFCVFTFLPVLLNFYVSFTSGDSISIFERPFVGFENYNQIFDCDSILEPKTCPNAGYNFWQSLFNTLLFIFFQVPILCVVALLTALVVNKAMTGRGLWRAMFFYPVMLSPVVIANIWQWILHRKGALNVMLAEGNQSIQELAGMAGFDIAMTVIIGILLILTMERALRSEATPSLAWSSAFGGLFICVMIWANPVGMLGETDLPLNLLLGLGCVGLLLFFVIQESQKTVWIYWGLAAVAGALLLTIQFDAVFDLGRFRPINWLVTPRTSWPFFWIVFVYCWSHMGYYMLILLAGLQAIPPDLYEAAKMDAARPTRVFWKITLPLLMPTFIVVFVLSLIKSFQIFDEVYLLTGGGPGRETFMIVQNIVEVAFSDDQGNFGEAAAASVLMALVIAVFTFFQLYFTRRQSGV
jgi:ABC-type sugar transport system permease subunit